MILVYLNGYDLCKVKESPRQRSQILVLNILYMYLSPHSKTLALSLHLAASFVTLACQPMNFHTRNNHCHRTHHRMFDDWQLLDDQHSASLIVITTAVVLETCNKEFRQENGYSLLHLSP